MKGFFKGNLDLLSERSDSLRMIFYLQVPTMFDKAIIFWLEFPFEPMTNQPLNYQLLHGPNADLKHAWSKLKFHLKLKNKRERGVVVRLEPPFPKENILMVTLSGLFWRLNV